MMQRLAAALPLTDHRLGQEQDNALDADSSNRANSYGQAKDWQTHRFPARFQMVHRPGKKLLAFQL
jgi:hypothetical protein